MAQVIVSLRVMPESPEIDLEELKKEVKKKIESFAGETEIKVEEDAIGFGLSALKFLFVMDESKGDTEPLEESIKNLDGVSSIEVIDVRRAIG